MYTRTNFVGQFFRGNSNIHGHMRNEGGNGDVRSRALNGNGDGRRGAHDANGNMGMGVAVPTTGMGSNKWDGGCYISRSAIWGASGC